MVISGYRRLFFSSRAIIDPVEVGKKAAMAAISASKEKLAGKKEVNLMHPANSDVVGPSLIGRIVFLRNTELYRLRSIGAHEKPYYMFCSEFNELMKKAKVDPKDYKTDKDVTELIRGYSEVYFPYMASYITEDKDGGGSDGEESETDVKTTEEEKKTLSGEE